MEFYEVESLKRQLARDIMRYLRLHPEVMAINQNKEVYEYVRDLRIKQAMKNNPSSKYADAAKVIDIMCEHELKKFPREFKFEQEVIDCFKPDAKKDAKYYRILVKVLSAYSK